MLRTPFGRAWVFALYWCDLMVIVGWATETAPAAKVIAQALSRWFGDSRDADLSAWPIATSELPLGQAHRLAPVGIRLA
jgi:hypothetical protein